MCRLLRNHERRTQRSDEAAAACMYLRIDICTHESHVYNELPKMNRGLELPAQGSML